MTKITQFQSSNLTILRQRINAALAPIATEFGISISAGAARYQADTTTFKLNLATIGDGGQVNRKEAADYELYHSDYGLPADGLNQTIAISGVKFKVVGVMPRTSNWQNM